MPSRYRARAFAAIHSRAVSVEALAPADLASKPAPLLLQLVHVLLLVVAMHLVPLLVVVSLPVLLLL